MQQAARRTAAVLAGVLLGVGAGTPALAHDGATSSTAATAVDPLAPYPAQLVDATPALKPVPRARCGPGSIPEPGMQGRVAAADVAAGRTRNGYRCNVELLGRHGVAGGFKVERFVDKAGRECAYYDTTLLFPTNAANLSEGLTGVAVLDMTDPRKPVETATLVTPAMQTPHESLVLNQKRGLLAAVTGNLLFAPGIVDIYDVNADCRNPVLKTSAPVGVLGHESGFAPDGNTFYASSLGGGTLTALDVTDPATPTPLHVGRYDTHSLSLSDDGNRAYLAASAGFPRNEVGLPAEVSGLLVVDTSQIQARVPNPQTRVISALTWPTVTIPQATLPVTIGGRPYLVEVDEFSMNDEGRATTHGPRVGAARIIDIADETKPSVVSDLRLEVHQREVRPQLVGDPETDNPVGGYAGHYCAVPSRVDPGIVACSFLASGLRVFDIRNPAAPKEVAYFVAPVTTTGNAAFSGATFVPERREIWYSDGNSGFYALRLTNDAWPTAAAAPTAPTGSATPAPSATEPPAAAPDTVDRPRPLLPATGGSLPLALGLGLVVVAAAVRRLRRD